MVIYLDDDRYVYVIHNENFRRFLDNVKYEKEIEVIFDSNL